jgi:uncharacterized RDD family membrane protein YckC
MTHEINQDEIHYLGFNKRFVAFLIDSTAASILMAPFVSYLIGDVVLSDKNFSNQSQLFEFLGSMRTRLSVDLVFMGSIFILFWIYKNSTPGKMLFKSVIVDVNTLSAPSTAQNIIRYLGYFISFLPLGLGFLWIAFDKRKQGWHDKLAGTVVIIGKPRPLSAEQSGETNKNE